MGASVRVHIKSVAVWATLDNFTLHSARPKNFSSQMKFQTLA